MTTPKPQPKTLAPQPPTPDQHDHHTHPKPAIYGEDCGCTKPELRQRIPSPEDPWSII